MSVASQERVVVQDDRSSVWDRGWKHHLTGSPTPREGEGEGVQKRTRLSSTLESRGWKRPGFNVRTQRSSFPELCALPPPYCDNLGKLWPAGLPPPSCPRHVSTHRERSELRAAGSEGHSLAANTVKTPSNSRGVVGQTLRKCRSGGATWLRRTPSWTPSSGNSTVWVRSLFSSLQWDNLCLTTLWIN